MVNPSKLEQHERALGRTSLIWGRLAIVVLLGIEALYFSLVAFGNITDYYTNFAFVKGVTDRLMKSGLFRTLGEGSRLPLSNSLEQSSGCQGSRPQKVEVRPAVALTLQQLELGDEAFYGAGASTLRKPRSHHFKILLQSGGELLHHCRFRCFSLFEPPV
jgi:hypothetical protein